MNGFKARISSTGGGATFDANHTSRLFNVEGGGQLELERIDMKHGRAESAQSAWQPHATTHGAFKMVSSSWGDGGALHVFGASSSGVNSTAVLRMLRITDCSCSARGVSAIA